MAKEKPVVLQLGWQHGFQFAGFYMAQAKGFYRQAGLAVEMRERLAESDPLAKVLAGRADYGVAANRIAENYLRGDPVVAVAAVFQHSARVIIATERSGITRLADLAGARVLMATQYPGHDAVAMLARENVFLRDLVPVPHELNMNTLADGRADAAFDYNICAPYELQRRGIPHRVFRPNDYGVDSYGSVLFTTRAEARAQPERVAAFRDASLQGWRYALDHVEETVDYIRAHIAPQYDRDKLLFEAEEVRKLVDPDLVAVGHMSPHRWRHVMYGPFAAVEDADELTHKVATEFMFDETLAYPSPRLVRVLVRALVLVGVATCLLLVVAYLLKVLVVRRTKALADANRALQEDILKRLATEELLQKQRKLAVALSESASLADCQHIILETMMRLPGVDCVGIYLKRQSSDVLELVLHQGVSGAFASQYARLEKDSAYGTHVLAGRSQCYDAAMLQKANDPATLREGLRAVMMLPVVHESLVVAAIHVASHALTAFSAEAISFGKTVAMQVGGTIARHYAAATLCESEENFRRVAECAFDGVVVLGVDGRPVYANPEALTFMGCTMGSLSERLFTDYVPPAFVERVKERFRNRLKGRFVSDHYELRLRRADGKELPYDVVGRRTEWKGTPAILYTFKDISERKRLEQGMLSITEWEKQRIAQDLHDSLGQRLVGIGFLTDALVEKLSEAHPQLASEAVKIRAHCTAARQEVRHIVQGVLPFREGDSLQQSLSWLAVEAADRLGVKCVFSGCPDGVALSPVVIGHLCHITQESVTNAVQHGDAKRVDISLCTGEDCWTLVVEDDGCGFDPADVDQKGAGLRIMRYRADIIGAKLDIGRGERGGARVACHLSYDTSSEALHADAQGEGQT
jgi:PAS domain S-box-containing protein